MDIQARNEIIARLLAEGLSLSDVQRKLEQDYQIVLTYRELRLISTELPVDWSKHDSAAKTGTIEDITKAPVPAEAAAPPPSRTMVTISKLVRPGAVFSGDVHFASGAKAEWALDQYGRLALNPAPGSSKPTEQDQQEFVAELQRQLQGKM
jgi:hypothetical protein